MTEMQLVPLSNLATDIESDRQVQGKNCESVMEVEFFSSRTCSHGLCHVGAIRIGLVGAGLQRAVLRAGSGCPGRSFDGVGAATPSANHGEVERRGPPHRSGSR